MPSSSRLLLLAVLAVSPSLAQVHAPPKISPKLLSAKSIYFEDRTGVPAVGKDALSKLREWSHFQIVSDKNQADLILLLSASPPRGDRIIYSGGQTGTIDEDPVPKYHQSGPPRAAYLTVFDAHTGESLWTDSHQWGGLLTGHNSAGARLISQLKKEMKE
jgi:hypothetical protein